MLQKTVQHEKKIEKVDLPRVCPKCNSTEYRKHGYRILKNGTKRQGYDCMQCNHKFTLNDSGFASMRFSEESDKHFKILPQHALLHCQS